MCQLRNSKHTSQWELPTFSICFFQIQRSYCYCYCYCYCLRDFHKYNMMMYHYYYTIIFKITHTNMVGRESLKAGGRVIEISNDTPRCSPHLVLITYWQILFESPIQLSNTWSSFTCLKWTSMPHLSSYIYLL